MEKTDKKVFLALHLLLLFYSLSSVLSKLAAAQPFLSIQFCLCYGGMFVILVLYALGWQQILKRLQPIADKQKVELVLESFRPITADVDEVKLTLAITNLVENGIKYNRDDGEGWVHVSLNADHQYFYLKVEDNGIGIPEESLEHIYERFYRVDKSHSREIGGTGLGLAITRSSILMHRGAIKAHSVLNEGTTFDVRIPLNYIA